MNSMNFDLAQKQLAIHAVAHWRLTGCAPAKPVHRPSVALILLATTVQIIAMAAVLGGIVSAVQ